MHRTLAFTALSAFCFYAGWPVLGIAAATLAILSGVYIALVERDDDELDDEDSDDEHATDRNPVNDIADAWTAQQKYRFSEN